MIYIHLSLQIVYVWKYSYTLPAHKYCCMQIIIDEG